MARKQSEAWLEGAEILSYEEGCAEALGAMIYLVSIRSTAVVNVLED